MAQQHHAPQGRIFPFRIKLLHDGAQRLPQSGGGIGDGVAGIIRKEPKLEILPDARVAVQVVHQVSPTSRTRRRPMDEDHRNTPRPVR